MKMRDIRTFLGAGAVGAFAMATSVADAQEAGSARSMADWRMEGFGTAHLRFNPYETLLSPSNVSGLQPYWNQSLGGCTTYGTPAVVDGVVYKGDYCNGLHAMNASTGDILWTCYTDGTTSSPAVVDGIVYVGSRHSPRFYAIDAGTGRVVWSIPTGGEVWGSATVTGGVVYTHNGDGRLRALDAYTGTVIWTATTAGSSCSTPAVGSSMVYTGANDGVVYAFDIRTGAEIWKRTISTTISATASLVNGLVVIGGDRLHAFNANTGATVWELDVGALWGEGQAIAVTPTDTRPDRSWQTRSGRSRSPSMVYAGTRDNDLYAVNAHTGEVEWMTSVGELLGLPAVANGVVYIASQRGPQYLYAFDGSTGQLLWSYHINAPTTYKPGGNPSVIVDGVVYTSATWGRRLEVFRLGDAGPRARR